MTIVQYLNSFPSSDVNFIKKASVNSLKMNVSRKYMFPITKILQNLVVASTLLLKT